MTIPKTLKVGQLDSHLAATSDPLEADRDVVHVEDELAQVAEEEAEDHQDQDPGQVGLALVVGGRLKILGTF